MNEASQSYEKDTTKMHETISKLQNELHETQLEIEQHVFS